MADECGWRAAEMTLNQCTKADEVIGNRHDINIPEEDDPWQR